METYRRVTEDYYMKSLYEKFTDEEFEKMQALKEASGLKSWHDFLLVSTGAAKKKDFKKKETNI